jgi:uncharacterized membrane protein
MARDFSNPKKLGFMRVIQVLFAVNIVMSLLALTFYVKGNDTLDFSDFLNLTNLIFDGIGFWFIWQRKKAARLFIIAFGLFNIAVGTIFNIATGTFGFLDQILASLTDLILLAYFLTSRRAKAVLIQPFSLENKQEELDRDINYYQPRKWSFWRNIIIYFCVFSVVGHWMEAGYCTLIRFGLLPGIYDPNSQIWSDWLYPFLVYGFGAAACILLLFPVKNFLQKKIDNLVVALCISFVINALVCTLIELVMGLMLNQPLPDGTLPLWDYHDMFCNFMGQVCLQNAVAFGLVATLMTWVIYPFFEKLLQRIPNEIMNIVFIVISILFCILFFFYCITILIPDTQEDSNAHVDDSSSASLAVIDRGDWSAHTLNDEWC